MSTDSYPYAERRIEGSGELVFTFHGTGGNENQFTGFAANLLPHATVISPRGDVSESGAGRYFRRTGEGVYDMSDLARATDKMSGFIKEHIEALGPQRVIGLGYSNGANILASVMFRDPSLFNRAVLMHPLIPFEPEAGKGLDKMEILITAGRHDPICPAPLTEKLEAFFKAQGTKTDSLWHEGGHEIRDAEIEAVIGFLRS